MTKKYEKESESDRRKGRKTSNKCDERTQGRQIAFLM